MLTLFEDKQNFIDMLDNDMLSDIFSFINPLRMLPLSTVSKRFYNQLNDNYLWIQYYESAFGSLQFKENAKIQFIVRALFNKADACLNPEKAQFIYKKIQGILSNYQSETWTNFYFGKMFYFGLGLPTDRVEGLWFFNKSFDQSVDEIAALLIKAKEPLFREALLTQFAVVEIMSTLLEHKPSSACSSLLSTLSEEGVITLDDAQLIRIKGYHLSQLSKKELGNFLQDLIPPRVTQSVTEGFVKQIFTELTDKYSHGSRYLAHYLGKLYSLEEPFRDLEKAKEWLLLALQTNGEALNDYLALKPFINDKDTENFLNKIRQEGNKANVDYNLGINLFNENQLIPAIQKLKSAASSYLPAKTMLGKIYHKISVNKESRNYYHMAVKELYDAFTAGDEEAGDYLLNELKLDLHRFKESFFRGNWNSIKQISFYCCDLSIENYLENPINILWLQLACHYDYNEPLLMLENLAAIENNPYACVALGVLYTNGICNCIDFKPDEEKGEKFLSRAFELDPDISAHYLDVIQREIEQFAGASLNDFLPEEIEMMIKNYFVLPDLSSFSC